jgi:uncharacterized protein
LKKIALISDSHGFIDPKAFTHMEMADEIWHAGDIGDLGILDQLPADKVLRIITGNIDGQEAREVFPEAIFFEVEAVKIYMLHIGGKPPHYAKGVKNDLNRYSPQLFVCGHSHICKVEFDPKANLLYMNPGAVGNHGFHVVKTMLLFELDQGQIKNLRVVELGKRGK